MTIHIEKNPFEFKLCYVCPRYRFAWFTSVPLEVQWGDDWDDSPYEHNAGDPYEMHYDPPYVKGKEGHKRVEHRLVKVAWNSEHEMPNDHVLNSNFSVKGINAGNVAWLMTPEWKSDKELLKPIPAGTTLREFVKIIKESGGEVYLPTELAPQYIAILYTEKVNDEDQ